MTITVVRPVSAAGVWATNRKATRFVNGAGIVAPGTGIKVVRSGSGPAGANAFTGYTFDFSGLIGANEPSIPHTAPFAGTLSAVNSGGWARDTDTVDRVFNLLINGVASGTATILAGTRVPVWAFSVAGYARGAYLELVPPAAGGGTIYGAALVVAGS